MFSMGKNNKKDLYNILILTIIFIAIIFFVLRNKYIWGSNLDWISQHSVIPDYFRTLFYDTHNFFPSFAFNLGAGQNIYNFAYYGLLNPIIIISYLLPFINMSTYIIYSSVLLIYLSIILFYYFLRKNDFDEGVSLITSICFMTASPLLFHSHRHIMFVNYMPFLILSLISVDKYFKDNNKWLLTLCVVLIILMNFYYSIPSIICIIIYGIYKYIKFNKKISFKKFIKDGIKFIFPILIGILICGILLVPELYVILVGRGSLSISVSLSELLIPKIHVTYILYSSYGLGLTFVSILSIISLLLNKNKSNMFLGIMLILFIIFPIFNYLLNGLMYLDSKTLIPLVPLYCFAISIFLNDFNNLNIKVNKLCAISLIVITLCIIFTPQSYKLFLCALSITTLLTYLTYKRKKFKLFNCYIIIISIILSLIVNTHDDLISKDNPIFSNYTDQKTLIDHITNNDNAIYRISSFVDNRVNSNSIFNNINMYQDTIYSSIYNKNYNAFYYDVFNNSIEYRNKLLTTSNSNIMFLMFMNNKYILSENDNIVGYSKYKTLKNINAFINKDVLPLMYVSYNSFNEKSFNELSFPYNNEILLRYVVTKNGKTSETNSSIHELNIEDYTYNNITVNKTNNSYSFKATDKSNIIIYLPPEAKNRIIMISFDMDREQNCRKGDQAIIINNQINKLTCKQWKYKNNNKTFTYTLSNKNVDKLTIKFYKGYYKISNIKLYYLDYNDIKNVNNNVDEAIIDKDLTKGDYIYTSVNNKKDGYFVTTIPYQDGFEIMVDGIKTKYENINSGFIGFKINKGNHSIVFKYTSPYKNIGAIISIIGIIIFVFTIKYNKK